MLRRLFSVRRLVEPLGPALPLAVRAHGDAGFDFGNGVIDYLNSAPAVPAFVVLGSLQRGSRLAQMRKRSAHVGLIRASGFKTKAGHQDHENDSCS
jgi:hypothetical protein